MNIGRGLFRLWLVLAIGYILIAGFLMFGWVKGEFDKAAQHQAVYDEAVRPGLIEDTKASGPWTKYQGKHFRLVEELPTEQPREPRDLFAVHPWDSFLQALLIATIPPFALLIIGAALVWAFAGFKREAQ
jgi:hypothetical protein